MTAPGQTSRSQARRLRLAVLTALTALLAVLASGGPAAAEAPSRLADQLTDSAGVLDGDETEQVQVALDDLDQAEQLQLFVVFVDSFDGMANQEWAAQTAQLSGFGADDVLLAVAVTDREYAYGAMPGAPISDEQLDQVAREQIEPALGTDDWAGAAVAAAQGYSDVLSGGSVGGGGGGGLPVLALLGVALAMAAGWLAVRAWRRRRAAGRRRQEQVASTANLRAEANRILVATDDAVRRSEQELGFAEAEFSPERTAAFVSALQSARAALARAFELRQLVDDDEPETDAQRRDLLDRLVAECRAANKALDAESKRFDALRDLVATAPARLEQVLADADTLEGRVPDTERDLAALRTRYAATALGGVDGNIEEACARIDFARRTATSGQQALAGRGRRGAAADAVRAAEEAVGQARTLLDGVARAGGDLADAVARLPDALADARADLDVARREAREDPQLADAVARAAAGLADAGECASSDPLGSLHRVVAADAELDQALDASREARAARDRAQQGLAKALTTARAELAAAEDFVATRRGVVGAEARTRLAESRRHLEAAEAARGSDPVTALAEARTADRLAQEGGRRALADVQGWRDDDMPTWGRGRSLGNDSTAMLGGILIGHVLGGSGRRGGGFGGFGGGGFGGGGFGGGGFGGGGGRF